MKYIRIHSNSIRYKFEYTKKLLPKVLFVIFKRGFIRSTEELKFSMWVLNNDQTLCLIENTFVCMIQYNDVYK